MIIYIFSSLQNKFFRLRTHTTVQRLFFPSFLGFEEQQQSVVILVGRSSNEIEIELASVLSFKSRFQDANS
jgi:hypothetical protein